MSSDINLSWPQFCLGLSTTKVQKDQTFLLERRQT